MEIVGIGRSVAIYFAKEDADVAIVYFNETNDAKDTKRIVESLGRKCLLLEGDLSQENFSQTIVDEVMKNFGTINILVNNCATNIQQNSLLDISSDQLKHVFETNVYSFFYLTKAVLPHLTEGSSIINTTSVTAYQGAENAIDYSCSKGALVTFTKSMALSLINKEIRVNAISPGPIWTPFIPSTTSPEKVNIFGSEVPLKRAGQPFELAPAYVYLASDDSRYVTGQTIHINGGIML